MFLSLSRVAGVAVLSLSLTLSLAPVAHARPQSTRATVVKAESSWLEGAAAWLAKWVTGEKPGMAIVNGATGSCIDPLGNPIPCPK